MTVTQEPVPVETETDDLLDLALAVGVVPAKEKN